MERKRLVAFVIFGVVACLLTVTIVILSRPEATRPSSNDQPHIDIPLVINIKESTTKSDQMSATQTDADDDKIVRAARFLADNQVIPLIIYGAILVAFVALFINAYRSRPVVDLKEDTLDTQDNITEVKERSQNDGSKAARHLQVFSWWFVGAAVFILVLWAVVNLLWYGSLPFNDNPIDRWLEKVLIILDKVIRVTLLAFIILAIVGWILYFLVTLQVLPTLIVSGIVMIVGGCVMLLHEYNLLPEPLLSMCKSKDHEQDGERLEDAQSSGAPN